MRQRHKNSRNPHGSNLTHGRRTRTHHQKISSGVHILHTGAKLHLVIILRGARITLLIQDSFALTRNVQHLKPPVGESINISLHRFIER